ncbi:MAG TPA: phospho-N-acetylmuramoyl-pentapeptide-transferase [Acidimicrobiales bacterium]|nr:phospho-N-acetylmuramoyl-pentapeptide-transferase [Acidimicrobiales bacterium]
MISIFTAGGVAILVAGFGTPLLLRFLVKWRIGQHVREDGPGSHAAKQGTPTMGGIAMLAGMLAGYVLGHVGTNASFTRSGWLVVLAVLATGVIGAADDWIKVSRRRSLGLNKRAKASLQLAVAIGFGLAAMYWAGIDRAVSFTRFDFPNFVLPVGWYVLWCVLVIVGGSNSVNLTDGLDGLAAGSSAFAFSCLALIGYWQFRHFGIYHVSHAIDLALVAVSMAGACVGFLWWNAAPARIMMGDTGSLAIGTGIACLGLSMNVTLLIPIIGGLFVVVTLSVVIQVIAFRIFHTRVFRMAPLHHHFELLGWPETTVTVRFWIFSGLCTALGLGLFYADYLSASGTLR